MKQVELTEAVIDNSGPHSWKQIEQLEAHARDLAMKLDAVMAWAHKTELEEHGILLDGGICSEVCSIVETTR